MSTRTLVEDTVYPVFAFSEGVRPNRTTNYPVVQITGGEVDLYTSIDEDTSAAYTGMVLSLEDVDGMQTIIGNISWLLWKTSSGTPVVKIKGGVQ